MADLRLGAIDLPAKDVAYLRALVRLFTHTEKLGWEFVTHPPYHAVVAARGWSGADPSSGARFAGPILTLVDPPGAPAEDTVAYPIHAQQFCEWLKLRQESLLAALYRERMADVAAIATAPRAAPATSAVPSTAPAMAPATPNRPAVLMAGEPRFKLRRWPSPAQLGSDPARIRMATLMSRNAVGIARLVELTGQPEAACRQFVATLQDAGLVSELVPPAEAATAGVGAGTAAGSMADTAAGTATGIGGSRFDVPPAARAGLMASLRRHLGL